MQTPISGKAGKSQKVPRTSKARSAAQAAASNLGKDIPQEVFVSTNLCISI